MGRENTSALLRKNDTLPLSEVPREIAALTGQTPPSYYRIWRAVVDGKVYAERPNRHWRVRVKDLRRIAKIVGA